MKSATLKDVIRRSKDLDRYVHISIKNKYIYFSASKCASGTLKCYFQNKEYEGSHWGVRDVDDKRSSPHVSPYQVGYDNFLSMIQSGEYKKVAFVRNPYIRVLSCYLYRVKLRPKSVTSRHLRKSIGGEKKILSFEDFVSVIHKEEKTKMEYHYRPIYLSIFNDVFDMDYIGKVEELASDIDAVGKFVFGDNYLLRDGRQPSDLVIKKGNKLLEFPGAGELRTDRLGIENRSESGIAGDYYSRETIEMVREIYKEDLERYGYSYPF